MPLEYYANLSEAKECMIHENTSVKNSQVATLGGGCFWCMVAVFNEMNGVEKVVSGYSGGSLANPTYEQVCTGSTGHAEVIQITFDSQIVSYKEIVQIFFTPGLPLHTRDQLSPMNFKRQLLLELLER